jgi:L-rhamnose mutarotase
LLINYYDTEKAALLLVSNQSKASFKVGFSSIDKKLNHFMIDTNAENYKVFIEELFKYLKILNKI